MVASLRSPEFMTVLTDLEEERRRRVGRAGKAAAVLALLAAAAALYFRFRTGSCLGGVLCGFGALILGIIVLSCHTRRFVGAFKSMIMPELVRALGPGLTYYAAGYLSEEEFEACGLFSSPDRYDGQDLVRGRVGETHVRFSLVHAEEEYEVSEEVTETDSDGNTTSHTEYRTYYRDIFRGLLFSADCNKHFSGRTYVFAGSSGFFQRL